MNEVNIFSLKKKNVLITGATGYLGESMAWGLAEVGANVFINSRSSVRCERIVEEITSAGYLAQNAAFDVTDIKAIEAFFNQRKDFTMHCLINNAYAGGAGTIQTADEDLYINSFQVSVVSAHHLLQIGLPSLRLAVKDSGDASVINIASMYGLVSPDLKIYENAEVTNPPFYGASKAALLQFTKYAACEFGPEGIRVNSISPGPFPTKQVQDNAPDFVNKLANKVPLGRVGQAHEIKGAVVMLASEASTYINGTNIVVDGGWTAW